MMPMQTPLATCAQERARARVRTGACTHPAGRQARPASASSILPRSLRQVPLADGARAQGETGLGCLGMLWCLGMHLADKKAGVALAARQPYG